MSRRCAGLRCRDLYFAQRVQLHWQQSVEDLWNIFVLQSVRCACVESWIRYRSLFAHTRFYYCCCVKCSFTSSVGLSSMRIPTCFSLEGKGITCPKCFVGRLCLLSTGLPLFAQTSDPKIRACRVISLVSFQRSSCVTRLSDPRHVAGSLEANVSMPDVDTERLQKFFDHFNTKIAPPF